MTDKYIEVRKYTQFSWWVSYAEYHLGKLWRHDTTMDKSCKDAMQDAAARRQLTGYSIVVIS